MGFLSVEKALPARAARSVDIIFGMSTVSNLVSVDEYLHTVYRPDRDYADGTVLERNVGEKSHAKAQKHALLYLHERRSLWNIFVIQETHVQVSPTRFRIPDVCAVLGAEPDEAILTKPPFLCIEYSVAGGPHRPHAGTHRRLFQIWCALRLAHRPASPPRLDLYPQHDSGSSRRRVAF
jgi:hypothetical protein